MCSSTSSFRFIIWLILHVIIFSLIVESSMFADVNQARNRSWSLLTLSDKGKVSCSVEEREPLMGLELQTGILRIRAIDLQRHATLSVTITFRDKITFLQIRMIGEICTHFNVLDRLRATLCTTYQHNSACCSSGFHQSFLSTWRRRLQVMDCYMTWIDPGYRCRMIVYRSPTSSMIPNHRLLQHK